MTQAKADKKMTYEELTALGEQIGTQSKGLCVEVIDAHFNAALRHHEELLSLDDESAAAPSSP